MNGSSGKQQTPRLVASFPGSTHGIASAAVCLPSGSMSCMKTYRILSARDGFEERAVSIIALAGRCSVRVVATAGPTAATVTTTVASTSGRVATRGTAVPATHGRSAVASVGTTTTARAAATTASATVHARKVCSLRDDL